MEKFTKGPWEVDHIDNEQAVISRSDISWAIATCYCDPMSDETIANAKLISRASEMYDHLKDMVERWDRNTFHEDDFDSIRELLDKINS